MVVEITSIIPWDVLYDEYGMGQGIVIINKATLGTDVILTGLFDGLGKIGVNGYD